MIYECANVACGFACREKKHTRSPACDIKDGCVHSPDSPVATKLIHLRKSYSSAHYPIGEGDRVRVHGRARE